MYIKKGNTRIVLVFSNFVVKIARIRLRQAIKSVLYSKILLPFKIIKEEGWIVYLDRKKHTKKRMLEFRKQDKLHRIESEKRMEMKIPKCKRYEMYGSPEMALMAGIMANLQESSFYRQTKNPFVMPTYFSFFGLFNIQKKGEEITFWKDEEIWFFVVKNIKNYHQIFIDAHVFADIRNFVLDDNGLLKLIDYGSRYAVEFLKINGKNLSEKFIKPPS